ncbi:DUF2637 domain-containing protein [Microbacterium sp. NPDC055988]|uniref:DUF2637 domain-containing protein n=1 Tax=Microbacterium sp. NPDC055988 TaxID=3345671 RepID=UPI0035E2EA1F
MSDPLAVRPQNKALALTTAAGVGALAVGGFTLSFTALRELAQREFAITAELSFIYPLVIDGFIVIATAAAFTMKKRGPRVTWYPWAALVGFGALSVLGNAAHAIDNPLATFPAWVSALGASVPAVALLVASHLLVLMIDGKAAPRPRAKSTPAPAATPAAPREADPEGLHASTVETHRLHALDRPAPAAGLVDRVSQVIAEGRPVTAALIAEFEGVSERTGRRRLAELRESHPRLFDAPEHAPAREGVL